MTTKSSPFVLYKTFIDAYMQGHPEVAKCLRHYNALAEWNLIKNNEELVKANIEKYLDIGKRSSIVSNESESIVVNETSTTNMRKRTISSDDEAQNQDPLFDPNAVIPVEPTFSKRTIKKSIDEKEDETKPWVIRGIEKAKARIQAHLAKIEARRLAKQSRVKAPAQEAIAQEIKELSDRIANLIQVKNMGLSTEETNHTLKKLIRQKKQRSTELSLLQSKQRAGLRYRQRRKKRLETLCSADTEVATELLKLYKPSTIAVNSTHSSDHVSPDLLHTIEEIARIGGVSDENHRILTNKPCTTLDDLRDKIKERGFEIRRSSLFYRLIPSGAFSEDGKKHVTSTAVRLRKLQDIKQAKHEDYHFVSGTLRYIKDLAGTFGNDCVFYLVQDNKASVRIGRHAARGKSPLIMRLDYQMSTTSPTAMPAAFRHQLKPTVYASYLLDENGVITNSGPTYISIRSAKHDQANIDSEEIDFDRAVKLREFERTARNHIGEVKPIIIMNVDSINPTDYTRFRKTLYMSIKKFKKYNLDAFILVTQAPGQAAFNVVERRLALLSHDLSGLILPDEHFGTHLNISGLTIDAELEKMNFKKAGDLLAEVWNMNMIDGHQVIAEYIDPPVSANDIVRFIDVKFTLDYIIDEICDEDEEIPLHQRIQRTRPAFYPDSMTDMKPQPVYDINEYWCATHVFQTQYTIQIIRCTKPECCGPWRSNYIQVFPHRFLPPPVPFHRSSRGVRLENIESTFANLKPISPYYGTLFQRIQFHGIVVRGTQNQLIPFDAYCPSVQSKIHLRTCSICKQYIPSPTRLRNHYKVHQQRYTSKYIDFNNNNNNNKEEALVDESDPIDSSDLPIAPINISQNGVFLFVDMVDWLRSDFEDDPVVEPKQKSVAATAMAMIRQEKLLVAEANAAIAESAQLIEQSRKAKTIQNDIIESVATISVDNVLSSNDNFGFPQIKVEQDDVSTALEQLNVVDDKVDNSYDDLSDLIDKM